MNIGRNTLGNESTVESAGKYSRTKKVAFSMLSVLFYVISVPLLFPLLGGGTAGFVIFPVVVISWYFEPVRGMLIGMAGGIVINSLMLNFVYHEWRWDIVAVHDGIPGSTMIIIAGGITGYLGTLRRRLINEIRIREKIQHELEDKNREIVELTGAITHDLRNPLAGVRGVLELYGVDHKSGEDVDTELLQAAFKQVDYMQSLLDDLIDCSRFEQGREQLILEKIHLKDFFSEVVKLNAPAIMRLKAQVACEADGITVVVDRRAMKKVCMNLLGNSLAYSDPARTPEIRIHASEDGDMVKIIFKDNGKGIAADILPFVFDKFRRGANTGSGKGAGLGLSIVKGVVEAHGGSITVQSRENEGSTFVMVLPHHGLEGDE